MTDLAGALESRISVKIKSTNNSKSREGVSRGGRLPDENNAVYGTAPRIGSRQTKAFSRKNGRAPVFVHDVAPIRLMDYRVQLRSHLGLAYGVPEL
jgi:hypothetical protein